MSTLSLYNYRSRVNVQYVEIRVIYQGVLLTKPFKKRENFNLFTYILISVTHFL